MKATWMNLGAGVLALIWIESAGATLISEHFDSAASAASGGWVAFNNGVNGNVMGVTNSTLAGGAAPGEAQVDFRRSTSRMYYADTTLGGTLNATLPLFFSGKMDVTSIVGTPDFGQGATISYFNSNTTAYVGLVFNDNGGANITWGLRIIGDGLGLILLTGLDGSHAFLPNVDRTFSVSYDPFAGANGAITAAVSGAGSAITTNLTASQRAQFNALTFNAFGFDKPAANSTILQGANFRFDDVIYTVVPEPSTLLLCATGGWLVVRCRSKVASKRT